MYKRYKTRTILREFAVVPPKETPAPLASALATPPPLASTPAPVPLASAASIPTTSAARPSETTPLLPRTPEVRPAAVIIDEEEDDKVVPKKMDRPVPIMQRGKLATNGTLKHADFSIEDPSNWSIAVPSYVPNYKLDASPLGQVLRDNRHGFAAYSHLNRKRQFEALMNDLQLQYSTPISPLPRENDTKTVFVALKGVYENDCDINWGQRARVVFGPSEMIDKRTNQRVSLVVCKTKKPRLHVSHFFCDQIGMPFKMSLPCPYEDVPLLCDRNILFAYDGSGRDFSNRTYTCVCDTPNGPTQCSFMFDTQGCLAAIACQGGAVHSPALAPSLASAGGLATGAVIPSAPVIRISNAYLAELQRASGNSNKPPDFPRFGSDSTVYSLSLDPATHFELVSASDNWFSRTWNRLKRATVDKLTGHGDTSVPLETMEDFKSTVGYESWKGAVDFLTGPRQEGSTFKLKSTTLENVTFAREGTGFFDSIKQAFADDTSEHPIAHIVASDTVTGVRARLKKPISIRDYVTKENHFKRMLFNLTIKDKHPDLDSLSNITTGAWHIHINTSTEELSNDQWFVGETEQDGSYLILLHMAKPRGLGQLPAFDEVTVLARA